MTSTRTVIGVVGLALLGSVVGIVVLAVLQHPIPDVLQNIAVGSLTGLVGLLKNTQEPAPPDPAAAAD